MYKKLHTPEKNPWWKPYCPKDSFACLVPERVIMLTGFVYGIHISIFLIISLSVII